MLRTFVEVFVSLRAVKRQLIAASGQRIGNPGPRCALRSTIPSFFYVLGVRFLCSGMKKSPKKF